MSSQLGPSEHPGWQELPRFAEQLMAESTVSGQRELIERTARHLIEGDADLWLARPFYRLTEPTDLTAIPATPESALMQQALETDDVATNATPALALPLRANDTTVGVLQIERPDGQPFSDAEISLLQALSTQSAVAIENTRRYEASQAQAWISTVLLQVAEALQSLTTLDEVLETVVRLTPLLAGVDRCIAFLWNETAEAFVPGAAYGLTPAQQSTFETLHIGLGDALPFDEVRFIKEPVAIADAAAGTQLPADVVSVLGDGPLLVLPLIARDEVVGAMMVDDRSARSEFEDEWRAMIQGIAHQTATAVESTRLLEAQQEEAYVLASLLQVAQTVASRNELDEALSAILRITAIMVGVERAIIFLWDDERAAFQMARAHGLPQPAEAILMARQYLADEFPLLHAVRETVEPVLLDTSEQWDQLVPRDFATQFTGLSSDAARSLLAVPLSLRDDVLGVLLIEEGSDTSRRFREKRMEIISGVAQQAALAVQNDRLRREMAARERLEQELQLAREIQQTLMPKELPALSKWELAVTCRPALQVGGDFYDFFELPGGRLGLVIADVADKGMPAALFMTLTRALVRAAALEETSPAKALARVNNLLVPDAHGGMFVTAAYAVLSLDTGRLAYANAGHNPPLVCRPRVGEVHGLERGGMALGVLEGVPLQQREISVEPGDHVVFYTDGVTEAFSTENRAFGEGRLRAAIQSEAGRSARDVLDTIDRSVTSFIGDRPPSDDLTLMVLHRQA